MLVCLSGPSSVAARAGRRTRVVAGLSVLVCAAALAASAAGFPNTAPDAAQQWYLTTDNAWSAWPTEPRLAKVKVAVIDSGIDAGNPAFAGRIAAGRSFVPGSSWRTDTNGHGTFVAGLIAASPAGGVGISGMAFNAKLLVAKVVQASGEVSATAEARGDPLGGRPGRPGDQPEPRRAP